MQQLDCEHIDLKTVTYDQPRVWIQHCHALPAVFIDNTRIEEVTIEGDLTAIPDHCFSGCTRLKRVILPSTVQTIGTDAFWNCVSLSEMPIPNETTMIGAGCFAGCEKLTTVTIPPRVRRLEAQTFTNCHLLSLHVMIPNYTPFVFGTGCIDHCTIDHLQIDGDIQFEHDAFTDCVINDLSLDGELVFAANAFVNCRISYCRLYWSLEQQARCIDAFSHCEIDVLEPNYLNGSLLRGNSVIDPTCRISTVLLLQFTNNTTQLQRFANVQIRVNLYEGYGKLVYDTDFGRMRTIREYSKRYETRKLTNN